MKLDIRAFQTPITVNDVTDEVRARNVGPVIEHEPLTPASITSEAELNQIRNSLHQLTDELKIPIALRNVDLNAITSKVSLLAVLTHNLPRNEYNMPKILYRPDILDYTVFRLNPDPETEKPDPPEQSDQPPAQPDQPTAQSTPVTSKSLVPTTPTCTDISRREKDPREAAYQLMQELLDASTIILDYHEGYPSYLSSPVWKQFPWESQQEYDLFQKYLELPGARQIALLGDNDSKTAGELFHLNYWGLRCLASDTFAVVHYKRMRERRILQTDDTHFLESERILRLLIAQIQDVKWDVLQDDPKTFVEVMERVTKIQRAALGTTERRGDDNQGIPSVELIMRKSAEHLAPLSQNEDVGGVDIAKLLRDPKSVQDAQELILRIGNQSKD
jgi:hypothetical protein